MLRLLETHHSIINSIISKDAVLHLIAYSQNCCLGTNLCLLCILICLCTYSMEDDINSDADALKHALVHPRIKKPTLGPEVANHYRPISNLPYIPYERVTA